MNEEFNPKIVGFLCNWCSYTGADLAGVSRQQIPPSIRVIRVMCSGRIDPLFVTKTFFKGADGVMMMGCHPGDCHYQKGNFYARRRYILLKTIFKELGMESDRIILWWVSASEGAKYARVTREFSDQVTEMGPNPVQKEIFI